LLSYPTFIPGLLQTEDYARARATAPAVGGRGSSAQAEPGLRSGGTGTLSAFARCGTSRNGAVVLGDREKPWEVTRRRRLAGAVANDGKRLARNGDEALGGLPLQ
jgi:hypothetical protein